MLDIIYPLHDVFLAGRLSLLMFLLPQLNLTESLLHGCQASHEGSDDLLDCAYTAVLYVLQQICWWLLRTDCSSGRLSRLLNCWTFFLSLLCSSLML